MGAWAGGTASGISAKNARKDLSRANNDLTRRMGVAGQDYEARRPEAAEERMRALRVQLGLLEPLNGLTGQIVNGGGSALDLSAAGESPLSMQALPSQASPYDAKGNIDYTRLGLPKGQKVTPDEAKEILRQKLTGQGYTMPAGEMRGVTPRGGRGR